MNLKRTLVLLVVLLTSIATHAQMELTEVPQGLSLQGRIIKPDGLPLEDASVTFNLKIISPNAESCVLWEENRTVNMTNSKGVINFVIGSSEGTKVNVGHSLAIHQILKNSAVINSLSFCDSGNSYTPLSGDTRKIRVSFTVGTEVVTLAPDLNLRSVPYAMESENAVALNGKKATDFIQNSANITQTKVETLLLPANFDGLLALLNPTSTAATTGAIGIPTSDGSTTAPPRDGLMRFDEATKTVQVAANGQWQNIVTSSAGIQTNDLADEAITEEKISDEAITSDKIMTSAVTNSKIADGAITFNKIANGAVSTIKIVDSAITTAKILDGTINTVDLANNAITTVKILDSNVTTSKIADQNVTTAKIADSNVTTSKIADSNVTTSKIADSNVTTNKLADLNVTTGKLADEAVTTAKIADLNVTTAKLADNSVTTAKILNLNVTTAKIADQNVTSAKIADGNVTTIKIADGNVTDAKIASVSGAKVSGNISGNAAGFYGALAGDVVGGQTGTTVQRVQGRWVANVNPGVGQVLKWDGGQWVPQADNNSGGTITYVGPSTGLQGGGGSGAVYLGLTNTGVGAGWYGNGSYIPQFYVDAQGRITAVNHVAVAAAGSACGGNGHGLVYATAGSCGTSTLYQCYNGSTRTIGYINNGTTCDGDGDGF
ncbi:autotransporter outer membrane beta-barrel domain-containing protein [Bdellovibrio reynosensis]|uniref:Uncharacterized protein n=1 Tax=Bdellovibrio reynosensis TaxID=2835041 RepID=A0ABY4CCB0_9BACT|nr:hypothetical protein [Bdellovibrio reynosensis]UOF02478.1 hypothetical protein MNR06_05880 [Bdellovibrio reynosensis]